MAGESLGKMSKEELDYFKRLSDEKYMLDMQDWKATLRDEGRAEGIVEGLTEAAQRMKSLGYSDEQIRAVTGV